MDGLQDTAMNMNPMEHFFKHYQRGNQWNSEYLRLGEVIVHSFYFLDSLTGFAVGGPQVFHRTTDGGLNRFGDTG